ncbi:MAG: hypothetical protein IK094_01975, partial [Treponema sp.]|nr:hypothetical protein [Treponema sp.]
MGLEYVKAFDPSNLPKSFDEKDQNRRRCARQCQGSLGNLYNLIFDATAKANEAGNYPVSLELQEVTKYSDVWFKKLYNKARELNGPATEID